MEYTLEHPKYTAAISALGNPVALCHPGRGYAHLKELKRVQSSNVSIDGAVGICSSFRSIRPPSLIKKAKAPGALVLLLQNPIVAGNGYTVWGKCR